MCACNKQGGCGIKEVAEITRREGIRNTPTMKEARGRGQEKAANREVNMFEMRSPSVACVHVIHWTKSHKGAFIKDLQTSIGGTRKED